MSTDIENFTEKVLSRVEEFSKKKYQDLDLDYSKLPVGFRSLGVRTPVVRKISNEFFRELKSKGVINIDDILEYGEYLQKQKIAELRTIAVQWSFKAKNQFETRHFTVFERWLKKYVTGWGSTDNLCVQSLGYIVYKFPVLVNKVMKWTSSNNQWVRRASAVVLIYGLRRGEYLKDAFEIANAKRGKQPQPQSKSFIRRVVSLYLAIISVILGGISIGFGWDVGMILAFVIVITAAITYAIES